MIKVRPGTIRGRRQREQRIQRPQVGKSMDPSGDRRGWWGQGRETLKGAAGDVRWVRPGTQGQQPVSDPLERVAPSTVGLHGDQGCNWETVTRHCGHLDKSDGGLEEEWMGVFWRRNQQDSRKNYVGRG